ncbi:hypothetical protein O1611_g2170 [Lasiodiplodia mahajangana]|uniref:Uncharacterized protein n=1 Tax=Lasiodiplodia mahajangana TaxID=1108764 RepID=A0ACC2JVI9_9PEZI|nr:hypothetical protein O1611_g2170 [Lasiodiplodia mahajangana]
MRCRLQTIPKGQVMVFDLLERPAMWNSIWTREPFHLYHATVLGRPQGAEEWKVISHHDRIVENSLVRWDGSQPLGDRISSLFGEGVSGVTGNEVVFMFNDPAIIRVRYEHTAKERPRASYKDLHQIYVHPHRLRREKNKDGGGFLVKDNDAELVPYTLVAIVRCSRQAEEADRIRLYSVLATPISLPVALKQYVGTYWNLDDDDPGRVYLLFYAHAPPDPLTGRHGEPIARKPANANQIMKKIKSAILPL